MSTERKLSDADQTRADLIAQADEQNNLARQSALQDVPGAAEFQNQFTMDVADDSPAPEGGDDGDTVEVVVYGVKQQVPRAEIEEAGGVDEYQKHLGASYRLQQAAKFDKVLNERERNLAILQQALAKKEQALQTAGIGAAPAPSSGLPAGGADMDRIVSDLLLGDHDKAKQALSEITTAAAAQGASAALETMRRELDLAKSQQQVAEEQEQLAASKRQIVEQINEVLTRDYGDLVSSPAGAAAVKGNFLRLRAERPGEHPVELAREAAEEVRSLIPAQAPAPAPARFDKRHLPGGGGGTRQAPVQTLQRENPSDIVAQIRKSRGQD